MSIGAPQGRNRWEAWRGGAGSLRHRATSAARLSQRRSLPYQLEEVPDGDQDGRVLPGADDRANAPASAAARHAMLRALDMVSAPSQRICPRIFRSGLPRPCAPPERPGRADARHAHRNLALDTIRHYASQQHLNFAFGEAGSGSMTTDDAHSGRPPRRDEWQEGPQRVAEPELDSYGLRSTLSRPAGLAMAWR